MSLTPAPDRRQQPRIPGMVVTQPASHPHTCDELGVCQNTGLCYQCSDGTGTQRMGDSSSVPPQAGNIWFVGPEPTDELDADQPDWWPVTGLQIAAFWALFVIVVMLTVSACVLVAGHAWGLSTGDVVGALLAWGGA